MACLALSLKDYCKAMIYRVLEVFMKEKVAEFINVIFGFRKFIIMLLAMLIAIIFRMKGLINGENMVDLLKATIISFFGANGVEHIMAVVKDYAAAKGQKIAGEALVGPDQIDEAEEAKAEEKSNE
jgi:hypothetical protein